MKQIPFICTALLLASCRQELKPRPPATPTRPQPPVKVAKPGRGNLSIEEASAMFRTFTGSLLPPEVRIVSTKWVTGNESENMEGSYQATFSGPAAFATDLEGRLREHWQNGLCKDPAWKLHVRALETGRGGLEIDWGSNAKMIGVSNRTMRTGEFQRTAYIDPDSGHFVLYARHGVNRPDDPDPPETPDMPESPGMNQ